MLVGRVVSAFLAGHTAEDGIGTDLDIQPLRDVNIDTAEDGRGIDDAVAVDDGTPQVALDAAENGVQPGTLKHLAGVVKGGAGEGRRPASDGAVFLYLFENLFTPVAEHTAENQLHTDDHDDCREKQLPEHSEVQDVLTAEQQKHADADADEMAGLIVVREQADGAGHDDEQRPPAVKENVDAGKAQGIHCQNDANRHKNDAPQKITCFFHNASPDILIPLRYFCLQYDSTRKRSFHIGGFFSRLCQFYRCPKSSAS